MKGDEILSPEGRKRFFVVHGGLFSKDEVTLEDIRKIDRIGRQPAQGSIMCGSFFLAVLRSYSCRLLYFLTCRRGNAHVKDTLSLLMTFLSYYGLIPRRNLVEVRANA